MAIQSVHTFIHLPFYRFNHTKSFFKLHSLLIYSPSSSYTTQVIHLYCFHTLSLYLRKLRFQILTWVVMSTPSCRNTTFNFFPFTKALSPPSTSLPCMTLILTAILSVPSSLLVTSTYLNFLKTSNSSLFKLRLHWNGQSLRNENLAFTCIYFADPPPTYIKAIYHWT